MSESWATPEYRQAMVQKLDEKIIYYKFNGPFSKNPAGMEDHIYNKAKSKDEYLSYIAKIILHIESSAKDNK